MDELIDTLPQIAGFDDVAKLPHAFISEEGDLLISGEHGDDLIDYYGDFRGGTPYIHPELVAWASKNGGYWEWRDAGSIVFVR